MNKTIKEQEEIYEFFKSNTLPQSVIARKCGISIADLKKIVSRYEKKQQLTTIDQIFEKHVEFIQETNPELYGKIAYHKDFDIFREGFKRGYGQALADSMKKK